MPIEDQHTGSRGSHLEEGANTRIYNYNGQNVVLTPLDFEVMRPQKDNGGAPLSRISIGVLEDLGYEVDYSKADPYSLVSSQQPRQSLMAGFHPKDPSADKLGCGCVHPGFCNDHDKKIK